MAVCLVLFLTIFVLFFHKQATAQLSTNPNFIGCYYTHVGNYTQNSTYNNNLNSVLSDLVSHASVAKYFYNSSAGLSDMAYGQYFCRADVSSQLCHACVKAAAQNATDAGGVCYGQKEGFIYYQECTVIHSNRSMVGLEEEWPQAWSVSGDNASDPVVFRQVLGDTMSRIVKKAAYGDGFATGEGAVTEVEPLYCLVQCSPDILGSPCENCLLSALRYVGKCCGYELQWVLLFYPSCQIRYSLVPFYQISTATAPADHHPSNPTPAILNRDARYYVARVVVPVTAALLLLLAGALFCLYRRRSTNLKHPSSPIQHHAPTDVCREEPGIWSVESYSLGAIEDATNNFSQGNKLGQGGFGSVYKGILPNGQSIAVKRLSKNSSQGIREFKTEIDVLAKLQHRNLVRLLGYCVVEEERILVYEFLPNLNLNKYISDPTKSVYLNWRTRHKIIEGIAWGLRYLHIDSLLTIVHRDLKSSNILLDEELNPKIVDFGLAKLVNINENTKSTSRIAGTYGYMAPEYAIAGRYSIKSDIYSFGVIILEILTGKSVGQFYDSVSGNGLLHHAWRLWNERAIDELIDPILQKDYSRSEVQRCVQIGLLCIQHDTARRPTIRTLIAMLEAQSSIELPSPSAPSTFSQNTSTTPPSVNSHGGLPSLVFPS